MKTKLLTVLIALFITRVAAAEGVQTSGNACMPASYVDKAYFKYYAAGARLYAGTAARKLYCPIRLSGDTLSGSSKDFSYARVTVDDGNSGAGFSCRLRAQTLAGGYYYSSSKTTTSSFKGTAVLAWGSTVLNGGSPIPSIAYVSAICTVPAPGSYGSSVMGTSIGY